MINCIGAGTKPAIWLAIRYGMSYSSCMYICVELLGKVVKLILISISFFQKAGFYKYLMNKVIFCLLNIIFKTVGLITCT